MFFSSSSVASTLIFMSSKEFGSFDIVIVSNMMSETNCMAVQICMANDFLRHCSELGGDINAYIRRPNKMMVTTCKWAKIFKQSQNWVFLSRGISEGRRRISQENICLIKRVPSMELKRVPSNNSVNFNCT